MAKRYFNEASNGKPGVVSEELRVALGMSRKSLPIWIHRMRILGYPPGWLKKADMTNTTINFIDGDNDEEEGQINNEEKTYNTDSFFEYPGFNAPVPKGVKDDYERLGMPPMQKFQQLIYAKKTVQSLQPVPHRRSTNLTDLKDKNKDDESEDSVEELNDENSDQDKSNKNLEQINSITETEEKLNDKEEDSNDKEEDLNDNDEIIVLDIEKRSLCAKSLKKATTSQIVEPIISSNLNLVNEESSLNQEDKIKSITLNLSSESNKNEEKNDDNQEHQDNQNAEIDDNQNVDYTDIDKDEEDRRESTSSRITLIAMGAPVPASLNGEKPPLENFAVGMGELIYFENLPTSTGVFDRMRKVIKKIRKKLS